MEQEEHVSSEIDSSGEEPTDSSDNEGCFDSEAEKQFQVQTT